MDEQSEILTTLTPQPKYVKVIRVAANSITASGPHRHYKPENMEGAIGLLREWAAAYPSVSLGTDWLPEGRPFAESAE